MPKMTPTLWFNYNAEEAVGFWTSLLPDSRVDDVILAPSDNPSMEKGAVLAITFTLAGQTYNGIRPHSSLGYRPPAPEAILVDG